VVGCRPDDLDELIEMTCASAAASASSGMDHDSHSVESSAAVI